MPVSTIPLASAVSGTLPDGSAPSGSVIQVVQVTTTSGWNTTSSSFVPTTGFSASITPTSASNRVLVLLSGGDFDCQAGGRQIYVSIFRGSTNLGSANGLSSCYHDTARSIVPGSACVFDTPATTSSVTYTPHFRASANRVDFNSQQSQMSLTLMEIAA